MASCALVVATASLELGLDVGPLDLVVQIGSPRSLATLLQRAGRSGHARGATPRAILFPTTRDELVECAACVRGVRAFRLDRVLPPQAPLDVLAQQIVAACAAEPWNEDDLFALVRRSAHYAELARERFDEVVAHLCAGHPHRSRPARGLAAPRRREPDACTPVAARAWRRSPPAAPSPRRPTTACWRIPTTPSSGP